MNKGLQVYAMPVFALLERMVEKRFNFPPGIALRLIIRSTYVGKALIEDLQRLNLSESER